MVHLEIRRILRKTERKFMLGKLSLDGLSIKILIASLEFYYGTQFWSD